MSDKHDLKDIFYLSPRDRRSVLLLLLIVLMLMTFYFITRMLYKDKSLTEEEIERLRLELTQTYFGTDSLSADINIADQQENKNQSSYDRPRQTSPFPLNTIDPNISDYQSLRSFGISHYAANNLLRYREKGARFNDLNDLLKVYGIDEAYVVKFSEYITFPSIDRTKNVPEKLANKTPPSEEVVNVAPDDSASEIKSTSNRIDLLKIDLNLADTIGLQKLRGIGSYFANRIVRYRELLGGYVSIEQLKEIKNLTHETYLQIYSSLYLDSTTYIPRRLNVRDQSFNQLLRHPYIDYEMAKLLKNIHPLRIEKELESLYKAGIIPDSLMSYLIVDYDSVDDN